LLPSGLLSLLLFVELGFIARSGPLPIDTTVAHFFISVRTPREVFWSEVVSAISTPIIVFVVILIVLVFHNYWLRSWYLRDFIPHALLISTSLISILSRSFFERSRPGAGLTTLIDFQPSYPSSHAVMMGAAGSALVLLAPKRRFLALLASGFLSTFVGMNQLTLGVHWLTDILGSYFLGMGILIIFFVLEDWLADREARNL
jgi:undecaprenyl-diphosphatase